MTSTLSSQFAKKKQVLLGFQHEPTNFMNQFSALIQGLVQETARQINEQM